MEVLVTADAFDPGAELSAFSAEGGGAVVTFTGWCGAARSSSWRSSIIPA
jgi:molybdopterin synthase catalytic subunit